MNKHSLHFLGGVMHYVCTAISTEHLPPIMDPPICCQGGRPSPFSAPPAQTYTRARRGPALPLGRINF